MFFDALVQRIPFLAGMYKKSPGHVIGVDIGPDSLKLLQIIESDGVFSVEKYASASLPTGLILKEEIKDPSSIGGVLGGLVQKAGLTSKNIALAIPRSIAIIKTINVDARLSQEDIESRAWIEANRHFPDLIGDIYLDFVITGPSTQDASQLELVLVACRKEQIKPYLEIITSAGLIPVIVDINSYALERALRLMMLEQPQIETLALLNLNKNLSTFIVLNRQSMIHAHDQTYDGSRLLSQVSAYFETKQKDSNAVGLVNDLEYNNLLKENLISHLRHTVHFFYSSRPNINLQKIILSGDCAVVPDLSQFIQNEIGIETVLANPFDKMKLGKGVDKATLGKESPALMLACGLALSKQSPES